MIAVVDSGSGNLRSVEKALAHVGGRPVVTSDPDVVLRADRVVVPGQGAMRDCMAGLAARGLDEALRAVITRGRPYLGICLGLQVLFDESEEQGPIRGLGLIAGRVRRLRPSDPRCKVPHMGWNEVRPSPGRAEPLLPEPAHVYFVHSYVVEPADPRDTALVCDYAGEFAAAVRRENLFACQFHPEKSQATGLALLERFVACA